MFVGQHGIQRGVHHIHIRFRPGHPDIQPVSHALVIITQVGMGFIPGIIGVGVVMVGPCRIAHGPELIAEGKRQPVCRGFGHAPGARHGDQSQQVHILAVQRGNAPHRIVKIGKLKALAPQLIERRRQLRIDRVFPQALTGQEDQVFAPEQPGIVIFGAGRRLGKIAVHLRQRLIPGLPGQSLEVDIQHLFCPLRFGCRLRLRFCPGFYRFHGAEPGIARFDAEGGQHSKPTDRKIADKFGGIQPAGAHRPAGIQQHAAYRCRLQYQSRNQRPQQLPPAPVSPNGPAFPLPDQQSHRHRHQQQRPPALRNGGKDHAGKLGHLPCAAHRKQGEKHLENGVVDNLAHIENGKNPPQGRHDNTADLGRKGFAQKAKQQPGRQRKTQRVKDPLNIIKADGGEPQYQLHPQQSRREKPQSLPHRSRGLSLRLRFYLLLCYSHSYHIPLLTFGGAAGSLAAAPIC